MTIAHPGRGVILRALVALATLLGALAATATVSPAKGCPVPAC